MAKAPSYFRTLDDGRRWIDPYVDSDGSTRLVLTHKELRDRALRDKAYDQWLSKFTFMGKPLMGKQKKFQVVQILSTTHRQKSSLDWWANYQDCVFRVFVQPETRFSKSSKDHVQWYLLAPEESEMILRDRLLEQGTQVPSRNPLKGERFVSRDKRINKALLVPVECCRHFRHETTAGQVHSLL